MIFKNSLAASKEIIKKIVTNESITIDATAGNGNDTIFLSKISKKVYSFDIQTLAINNTRKKLEEAGIDNVTLIKDSHCNVLEHVSEKVKAVMFNLGYLPKGDHSISTNGDTTIIALNNCLELLDEGGVITMVIYHGQDSGFEERDKVLEYIKTIDPKKYRVFKLSYENQANYPPILLSISKI